MKKFLFMVGILMLLVPLASIVGNAEKDDKLLSLSNQSLVTTSEEVNPQWVEWAIDDRRSTIDEFYDFKAEWIVPQPPPDRDTTVFIGIMLDNHPGRPEYRGVGAFVWWGVSAMGGGPYWSIGVEWVQWIGPGNWNFTLLDYNAIENATETGHRVFGQIFKDEWDRWIVHIEDFSRPNQTCRAAFTETAFPYKEASVSLQIPNFGSAPSATKLPGTTSFMNLFLLKQGYDPTTSMWAGGQNYYGYGLGVTHDSTWVMLHTGTTVGGIIVPVDKFGFLAPYIGLASTLIVATVATAIHIKRVKRRKAKQ